MWHDRIEGTGEHLGLFATKDAAMGAGRLHAKKRRVDHIIKNKEGDIVEQCSYHDDALRPSPLPNQPS